MCCITFKAEYPEIVTKGLKTLLPFSAVYFCEAVFLQWQQPKWKFRVDGTWGIHFGCHCHSSPLDGTISLQGNKLRALTDFLLWYVVFILHIITHNSLSVKNLTLAHTWCKKKCDQSLRGLSNKKNSYRFWSRKSDVTWLCIASRITRCTMNCKKCQDVPSIL